MSVSGPQRSQRQPEPGPYSRIRDALAAKQTTIVKRFISSARSWGEHHDGLDDILKDLLQNIDYINDQFARLIGVVSQTPLIPHSESLASVASEISTSSLTAYHSPSGYELLTYTTQPMDVDHSVSSPIPEDEIKDFVMGNEEATRQLIVEAERLLSLKFILTPHLSMKQINQFNVRVRNLDMFTPVLYDSIKSSQVIIVHMDLAGLGWALVQQDCLDVEWPSPATSLALKAFGRLVVWHNERALEVLHKDLALGRKIRLIEACALFLSVLFYLNLHLLEGSVDILKGAHFMIENSLVHSRIRLNNYIREEMH